MNRTIISRLSCTALLVSLAALPALAFHFDEPTPTDANMSILVTASDIDGTPLSDGDEIGVIDPQGVCAGFALFGRDDREGQVGIAAWADDRATEEDEGFVAGDALEYRIWDARHEVEMIALAEYQDVGMGIDSVWNNNDFLVVELHARGLPIQRVGELEHDFGVLDMVVGEAVDWNTVIENIGNAYLTFMGVERGDSTDAFGISLTNEDVAPDSATVCIVTFPDGDAVPGSNYSGEVALMTNTPDSLIRFHFRGRIGAPRYELNREEIDFGTVTCEAPNYGEDGWELDSILIRNPGDATLLISNLHCTSQNFYLPVGDTTAYALSPGDSTYVKVVFRPSNQEGYNAWLTYESNAVTEPSTPKIPLRGEGSIAISVGKESVQTPLAFGLAYVYPNPFNGVATIRFLLPTAGTAQLAVYDVAGSELTVLATGAFVAGEHSVSIESHDFPAGMYIARLRSGASVAESRFVIVK